MAHYKKPYDKNLRAQNRRGEDEFRAPSSLRNYAGRKIKNENPNYPAPSYYKSDYDASHPKVSWRTAFNGGPPPPDFTQKDKNSNINVAWRQINDIATKINGNSKQHSPDLDKQAVDLVVSNLDSSIAVGDLKRLLSKMLKEFAMITSLKIIIQADGTACAHIRVSSQQEAQFAISQLHRQKLGQKRITISYAQNNVVFDPEHLKSIIVSTLQEAPDKKMALFKFISLIQIKYQWTLSISDVSKLKDVCKITEEQGYRIISLTEEVKTSPVSGLSKITLSYCSTHCPNGLQSGGWCEYSTVQSPNVMVSLKFFSEKVHKLLDEHMGSLPLLSFQACYEQTLNLTLPVDDEGVALEHVVSCLPNIVINCVGPNKNIKIINREIRRTENEEESFLKGVPPVLRNSINLLCRELVDFLRTMDRCQLPLSKFIPAYHHHFGRQCRVADYGFTKLIDLFESIPHIVQIIGHGTRRLITLSHTTQMRRFTSDLLKVLKVQPCRQISLLDFPSAYEKIMNKPFSPIDYGVCMFDDLLAEIPESVIAVTKKGDATTIGVPKKEQTPKEIAKTMEFSNEVIELLRHSPYCTLIFSEFIPAYHHHFGHQCKVADYGFTKLIELFEAIPNIVKIMDLPDGERAVSLTLPKLLQVLGCQILDMIKYFNVSAIFLAELPMFYLSKYGYPFKPEVYECDTVEQVILNLSDYIQLLQTASDLYIVPNKDEPTYMMKIRVWSLLLVPPHCNKIATLKYEYQAKFETQLKLEDMEELKNVICISHSSNVTYVSLTKLYVLAAQIYHVLFSHNGHVPFSNLEMHLYVFKKQTELEDYNILSPNDLVRCFGFLLYLSGSTQNPIISLKRELADHQVPIPSLLEFMGGTREEDKKKWLSVVAYNTPPRKIAPPKPETPPTPGTTLYWNSPNRGFKITEFSVPMPRFNTPKMQERELKSLISPYGQLFLPENNPSFLSDVDNAEIIIPEKLNFKGSGMMSDDSNDSGVNSKLDISPPEIDYLGSSLSKNSGETKSLYTRFLNF